MLLSKFILLLLLLSAPPLRDSAGLGPALLLARLLLEIRRQLHRSQPRHQLCRRRPLVRVTVEVAGGGVEEVLLDFAHERPLAGAHEPEDEGVAVHVHLLRVGLRPHDLGGHVAQRPSHSRHLVRPVGRVGVEDLAEPEVGDLEMSLCSEEEVPWLEVAVYHWRLAAMEEAEGHGKLEGPAVDDDDGRSPRCALLGSLLLVLVLERSSIQVLAQNDLGLPFQTGAEEEDQVGVPELRQHLNLVLQERGQPGRRDEGSKERGCAGIERLREEEGRGGRVRK
eukprot:754410-Hanusia_phi.AAC.3